MRMEGKKTSAKKQVNNEHVQVTAAAAAAAANAMQSNKYIYISHSVSV